MKEEIEIIFLKMEQSVLDNLSNLEIGYGRRKWVISRDTGIPTDILTLVLKKLKYDGKIEIIMTWSESTGLPDGSGYCLSDSLKN